MATLDQGLVDSERTGLRTPSELLPYWRAADYPVAIRQGGTPRMDVAGWEAFPSWLPGCPPREKARPPPALSLKHRRTLARGGPSPPRGRHACVCPGLTPRGSAAPARRCCGLRPGRSRTEGDASHPSPPTTCAWRGLGGVTAVLCRASTYAAWYAITAGASRAVVHPHRGHRLVRACGAQAEHSGTS